MQEISAKYITHNSDLAFSNYWSNYPTMKIGTGVLQIFLEAEWDICKALKEEIMHIMYQLELGR